MFFLPTLVKHLERDCTAMPNIPKMRFYKCSTMKATNGPDSPTHKEVTTEKIEGSINSRLRFCWVGEVIEKCIKELSG